VTGVGKFGKRDVCSSLLPVFDVEIRLIRYKTA
jgi:hypothetical protein